MAKKGTAEPEIVRVLRVIEYVGPRAVVEVQIGLFLHGTKRLPNGLSISAATIGEYPEILLAHPKDVKVKV